MLLSGKVREVGGTKKLMGAAPSAAVAVAADAQCGHHTTARWMKNEDLRTRWLVVLSSVEPLPGQGEGGEVALCLCYSLRAPSADPPRILGRLKPPIILRRIRLSGARAFRCSPSSFGREEKQVTDKSAPCLPPAASPRRTTQRHTHVI